jgi:DNA-directed RNA polymerase specialized sigma24 family protein
VDFLDTGTSLRPGRRLTADEGVTALYAAQAVGLIRLGFGMLGDRGAAEDVVQDAFLGLYRNWGRLDDRPTR